MKSPDLHTVYSLTARDYQIEALPNGKFRHSFSPESTGTVYEFEANEEPVIIEGQNYNVGFKRNAAGRNIVDRSTLSLASVVNPTLSYLAAQSLALEKHHEEKAKNDARVTHAATDDYYWGKKHAWRMFGAFMAEDAFIAYLDESGHKSVPCTMYVEGYPPGESTAYAETGLEDAAYLLLTTAVKQTKTLYQSPHYSGRFTIYGINAISHKK